MPGISVQTLSSLGITSSTNATSNLYKDILRYLDLPEPLIVAFVAVLVLLFFILFVLLCSRCCCKKCCRNTADKDKYKKRELDIKEIENILHDEFNRGLQQRCGKISFAMKFNFDKNLLMVKIISVDELPMPLDGSLDSYVVTQVQFDSKVEERCTRKKMKTLKPVFNQKFTFKLSIEEFIHAVITFKVYDFDKFGADSLLGQLTLKICDMNWDDMINMLSEFTKDLEQGEDTSTGMGQICVILNNSGQMGLNVTILEAKDVRVKENSNYSHIFVTVKLKSRHNSKNLKTHMKKRTKDCPCTRFPYFNESFLFPKPQGSISDCQISIKVWMSGIFKMPCCVGYVVLGSDMAFESGGLHWQTMLDNPRHPIAKWHMLKNPSTKETES